EQAAWQDEECVALAEVVAVCRSADGAAAWPDEARAALERLADPTRSHDAAEAETTGPPPVPK
ncbi:MAG TPA: hypothetical protein VG708_13930, partial [Mycobacteriales bacterium]|nr:hypothetical protein [Mycobacteriales bacterium]